MMKLIEKRTGLKLKKATKYEKGKTYYCGYWGQTFKVIDIVPTIFGESYKCQWSDGTISTHATKLNTKEDFEVIKD